jgi:hypothetical protein
MYGLMDPGFERIRQNTRSCVHQEVKASTISSNTRVMSSNTDPGAMNGRHAVPS